MLASGAALFADLSMKRSPSMQIASAMRAEVNTGKRATKASSAAPDDEVGGHVALCFGFVLCVGCIAVAHAPAKWAAGLVGKGARP